MLAALVTLITSGAWGANYSASALEELDFYNRAARECTVFVMNHSEFTNLRARTPICQQAVALRQDLMQKGIRSEQLGYEWLSLPDGHP
jgi:hypothetical protein